MKAISNPCRDWCPTLNCNVHTGKADCVRQWDLHLSTQSPQNTRKKIQSFVQDVCLMRWWRNQMNVCKVETEWGDQKRQTMCWLKLRSRDCPWRKLLATRNYFTTLSNIELMCALSYFWKRNIDFKRKPWIHHVINNAFHFWILVSLSSSTFSLLMCCRKCSTPHKNYFPLHWNLLKNSFSHCNENSYLW